MLQPPTNADLKPKRYHGYSVVLFILGTLFPPLAVAARFGIGSDFWLNLLLTICGYIPGHVHNFYIQNIRNNKNNARTPKWAQRYGLVDTTKIQRNKNKSQWAGRYNDRLPNSTLENQPYEEGQERGSSTELSSEGQSRRQANGELWTEQDESYYGGRNGDAASGHSGGSGGRWRYPANFEDAAAAGGGGKKKKKKEKMDRWARTEDAYSLSEEGSGRKKKKKKSKSAARDGDSYSRHSQSTTDFPEDAEGGLYSGRASGGQPEAHGNGHAGQQNGDDLFAHQF